MKHNKFFSLKRFGRLMAADLQLNGKKYIYTFMAAAILLYLTMLFLILSDTHDKVDKQYYFVVFNFFMLGLGAYVGNAFPLFGKKTTTAHFLLFPASNFEKLLSQFLLHFVAGIVIFIPLFWIDAHLVRLSLLNSEIVRTGTLIIEPFSYGQFFYANDVSNVFNCVFLTMIFLSIYSFFFAARLFFGKFALAKSVISGIVITFLFCCLWVLCSHLVFPNETQGFDIYYNNYYVFEHIRNLEVYLLSLGAIICLFFLPLAYFKLKEKQL